MGKFLVNFIKNMVMILLLQGAKVLHIYRGVRGICLDLIRSGSHSDMWARWSCGVVFNITPNEGVA